MAKQGKLKRGETSPDVAARRHKALGLGEPLEIPEFSKRRPGKRLPLGNLTLEDHVWVGDEKVNLQTQGVMEADGFLDPVKVLESIAFAPNRVLRLLLGAIIDAHPSKNKTRAQRLDSAEANLIGRRSRRGPDDKLDDEILLAIARQYWRKLHAERAKAVDVGPIAREILLKSIRLNQRKEQHIESAVRRLQRKFDKNRDVLLVRVSTDLRSDAPELHARIHRILSDIAECGIKVDKKHLGIE